MARFQFLKIAITVLACFITKLQPSLAQSGNQVPVNPAQVPANPVQQPIDKQQPPVNSAQSQPNPAQAPANPVQQPTGQQQAPVDSAQSQPSPAQAPANPAQQPTGQQQPPVDPAQSQPDPAQQPPVDPALSQPNPAQQQPPVNPAQSQPNPAQQPPVDPAQSQPNPAQQPPVDPAQSQPNPAQQPPVDPAQSQPNPAQQQPPVNPAQSQPNPAQQPPVDPAQSQPNPAQQPPVDPAQSQPNPAQQPPVDPAQSQPNPAQQQPPVNPAQSQPNPAQQPPVDPAQSQPNPAQQQPPVNPPQPQPNPAQQPTDQQQPPVDPAQSQPSPVQVPADPAQPPAEPAQVPVILNGHTSGTNPPLVCDVCNCPFDTSPNPYVINCTSKSLNKTLGWSIVLKEVDNVNLLLHHNEFTVVSVIDQCDTIDSLEFSFNQITDIMPSAFANLPNLKRVILDHNHLTRINPNSFYAENFQLEIEVLDLSYNQITSLHDDVFDNIPHLEMLNLEGNPLSVLDSSTTTALNNLKYLQELNLAATGLKELPMALINPIKHLVIMNLSYNEFTSVPEVLQHGSELTELIISGNPIPDLTAASFIELKKLQVLEVCNMPNLKMIHKGTFFPLTSLTTLRCNNNPKLRVIERRAFRDENGEGSQDLTTIELRNNSLTTLSEDLFKHLHINYIETLDASDNPFNCTCHMAWLLQEGAVDLYAEFMKCASPASLQGISIKDIDFSSSQVPCPDPEVDELLVQLDYSLTESYGFWLFVLVMGLVILVSVAIFIVRAKPELRYSILKIVSPSQVQYREEEAYSSKVKYSRQEDDEDVFGYGDIDLDVYKR